LYIKSSETLNRIHTTYQKSNTRINRKNKDKESGHLSESYSDLIKQLNSISNLTCDFALGFDISIVFHGVVEWSLYDFVRGFVENWGDHWRDIPTKELEKLEVEGLLERREI
jgi:hypothetical protein